MAKPGLKPGQKEAVGAGRQKGTPNKSTLELKSAIAAVCGEDWDPVVAMAKIAKEGVIPTLDANTGNYLPVPVSEKTRTTCLKEVSEYIHAKRKSIDIQTPPGEEINVKLSNDVRACDTLASMLAAVGSAAGSR